MPLLAAPTVLGIFVTLAGQAHADPPAPFSSVSGSAGASAYMQFYGPPVSTAHANVVVRLSQVGSSGVQLFADGSGDTVGPGDVVWETSSYLDLGDSPELVANNLDDVDAATVSAKFFDYPAAPVSFSGVSSTASPDSTLPFIAPGSAPYVANVAVAGGAIDVDASNRSQVFGSSGQLSLGTLGAGTNSIDVDPVDGPQAQWSISISPQPITITGQQFDHAWSQPGITNTLHYSVDGNTDIRAQIKSASGTAVRTFASALPEGPGAHTLVWDGRNSSGDPVPTGTYTAKLTSTDPVGNVTTAQATIGIDSTPPTVSLAHKTLRPTQAVVVQFKDRGSGVAKGSITVDEAHRQVLRRDENTLSYGPGEWVPGRHRLVAIATDQAGNRTTRILDFRVVGRATRAVLGSHAFAGRYGLGWGTSRPSEIFNGGDPSGLVRHIHWTAWGALNAYATGQNAIFKPRGGYYSTLATIQLHATDMGRCSVNGPVVYRRLYARIPNHPGGQLGRPFLWSGAKTLCRDGF